MSNYRPPKFEVGQRFGRVTVVGVDPVRSTLKRRLYLVVCDCGTGFSTRTDTLSKGMVVSCGCKKKEHGLRHGYRRRGTQDTTYNIWANMVQRCTNPAASGWKYYGARGITVCKRWLSFEHFLADMGERPPGLTLERKNNNLGYRPSNCAWATRAQQARNRRAKGTC